VVSYIKENVTDWMFMLSPNSYFEILVPKLMVLGDGASGKWSGHEDQWMVLVSPEKRGPSLLHGRLQ
jgi:hypothetical protein